jgi:hypothetical protein
MKQRIVFALMVSMMAIGILACQVGGILPGAGTTIRGSGNVVTREEAITGFDNLEVSHSFEVDVRQGEPYSVVIRVDDNLVEHLHVAKDGNMLVIGLEPGRSYSILDATLEADVTMPQLTGADLSGASHLQGDVEAGDVTFKLAGASSVALSGSAEDLTLGVEGGSQAELADLAVVDAKVDARGASQATVRPSGRLDVVAKGGSTVRYLGNPTLGTIDADVSSSIEQE